MYYIDARLRPPFGGFIEGFYKKETWNARKKFAGEFGLDLAPSFYAADMDLCLKEMAEANVGLGIAAPRRGWGIGNEDVPNLLEAYPEKFVGFISLLPTEMEESLLEIDKYIINGPCTGIYMEPSHDTAKEKMEISDERLFPIYEKCVENNIPISYGYGGFIGTDLIWQKPESLLKVVKTFPKLKLNLNHAGFPYIIETCHIAYRNQNVWLSPDLYSCRAPGRQDYIEAANFLLPTKITFGSAYPLVDLRLVVKIYERDILPHNLKNVMYKNAATFLGLE